MLACARGWLVVVLVPGAAGVLLAGRACGQELPPAPIPVAPGGAGPASPPPMPQLGPPQPLPSLPAAPPSGLAPVPPPPPPLTQLPAEVGDNPYGLAPEATLFFDVELDFLRPSLRRTLRTDFPLSNGDSARVSVPNTDLSWTVSPRFEVGSPFFALSYKFLNADGHSNVTADGTDIDVRSRVSLNVFDIDYRIPSSSFAPRWEVGGRVGIRAATLFYDTVLSEGSFQQQASHFYYGAGPHARLDLERHLALVPGVSFLGRLDTALLIGHTRGHFGEGETELNGGSTSEIFFRRQTQTVPALTFQAGLSYTPPDLNDLHFTVGYQFEGYWNLGKIRLPETGVLEQSHGALLTNGVFVNFQIDF